MSDVLFIKTSSLGDVIHHMPALTEARRSRPDARFAWVVDEAYAPLAGLHPAVDEVIPVAARAWRSSLHRPSAWRAMMQFVRGLRTRRYDEIVDTQGLFLKSALIARCARGRRHGYDSGSIRERAASWLYDVRHRVARDRHAIERNRALTGLALGYAPEGPPDYGLDRSRLAPAGGARYGILLHGTARPEKQWPEDNWRALAQMLGGEIDLVVLHGSASERARAERIASASPRAQVPEREPLDAVARTIAGASFVVGVDTGLLHLAAALGVPLVAIFCASEPGLTGPMGQGPMKVLGGHGAMPSVDEVAAAIADVTGARRV
ncbi:MAG: lipopolysaccharide heptosyltransferase I [Alphaproteobacteria bacterium]|nr:lipopolysaccharide heptosyltransferase I [Alphaproteobacteria bacterium]